MVAERTNMDGVLDFRWVGMHVYDDLDERPTRLRLVPTMTMLVGVVPSSQAPMWCVGTSLCLSHLVGCLRVKAQV